MSEALETTVARLDERIKGFQDAFNELASDHKRLTDSYEKLVESNQRVSTLEADMHAVKDTCKRLEMKQDAQSARTEDNTRTALHESVRVLLAIFVGFLFAKYGIKA